QSGEIFADLARQWHRFNDVRDTYDLLRRKHPSRPDYALEYAWFRALDYTDGDSSAINDAMKILDGIEAGTGIDADITLHRLRALSVAADTTAMTACIQRYIATAPADAQVNYAAGQMFGFINMPDSSLTYYSRACELDSTMGAAYLARAEQMLAAGDSAGYDREVVYALESPTLEFAPKLALLTNYTRALYQDEDRHRSISRLFGRMLDIHPGEAELHNLYGAYLATVDSTAAAAEQFGFAMDLDPDDEEYPQYLLQTALAAGDTVTAITTARTAASRFDNMLFPVTGAQILYAMGRTSDALAMLDSAKIGAQDNPAALSVYYTFRGDIQHALQRNDSAFVSYERAIALNPQNVGALNNLAYFMAVDGVDLDKAETYIRQALIEEPLNPTYIDTYAWVLFKKKDYTAARKQIDDVLAIYDNDTDTVSPDTIVATPAIPADTADVGPAAIEEVVERVDIYDPETPSSEIYDHALKQI
ncbi:MAG: tetratricopeptide repeat protein, partial [Muribaculaceae bacterium]|nr:tetratricopeptide repeat protein [Muribaculaceae bacterium]